MKRLKGHHYHHHHHPGQLHHLNQDRRISSTLVWEDTQDSQGFHDKMYTVLEYNPAYIFLEDAFERIYAMPESINKIVRESKVDHDGNKEMGKLRTSATLDRCVRIR